MTINVIDAGNYFRGLLLLIRKDGTTMQAEADLMRRIGKAVGFEKDFCENAIHEIHDNTFIVDEPPIFSSKRLAEMFLRDGVSVAVADGELHLREERWLRACAERNGLKPWFLDEGVKRHHRGGESAIPLGIEGVTVRP